MSESGAAYQGDEVVERLLRKAGSPYGAADLAGLLAGVAGAPEAADPEAWIDLVASDASEALKAQLRAYRAAVAAKTAGPDGRAADTAARVAAGAGRRGRQVVVRDVCHWLGDEHCGVPHVRSHLQAPGLEVGGEC